MDHNTMNFHRKFYRCNEAVKDCNVKPLSLTLYFKFLSPCLVSNYFAFGLTYKVSQFPVHVKDKYIYIYIYIYTSKKFIEQSTNKKNSYRCLPHNSVTCWSHRQGSLKLGNHNKQIYVINNFSSWKIASK